MIISKKLEWKKLCLIGEYINNIEKYKAKTPNSEGIYRIICKQHQKIKFGNPIEEKDSRIEHLKSEYLNKKNNHHESEIMYIGKANASNTLRNRLYQYMTKKGHRGGRAIWQIGDCNNLIIEYCECENCEEVEHELLTEFAKKQKKKDVNMPKSFYYPLANFKS